MDEIKMRVSGVEKSFPGVKALSGIDFAVRKGTVHALCGENGAGKSTLMKIIMGLYQADKGQIYLDEKPVTIKNPIQAREMGISMVAQELNYVPELSVEENLFFVLILICCKWIYIRYCYKIYSMITIYSN